MGMNLLKVPECSSQERGTVTNKRHLHPIVDLDDYICPF